LALRRGRAANTSQTGRQCASTYPENVRDGGGHKDPRGDSTAGDRHGGARGPREGREVCCRDVRRVHDRSAVQGAAVQGLGEAGEVGAIDVEDDEVAEQLAEPGGPALVVIDGDRDADTAQAPAALGGRRLQQERDGRAPVVSRSAT
jgi:hypothetical protein